MIGFGLETVDVLAHDHDRLRVIHVREHADRGLHLLHARDAELGEPPRLGCDRGDVVGVDRLRRVLDHVEDVVHLAHQAVDVVAVERRDESAVEELDRRVRDFVPALLDRFDVVGAPLDVVAGRHERSELAGAEQELLRVLVEEIEEPALARHESPEHAPPPANDARCGAAL